MVAGLPVGKRQKAIDNAGTFWLCSAWASEGLEDFSSNPRDCDGNAYTDFLKIAGVEGVKAVLREIIEDLTPKGESNDSENH